MRAMIFDDFFCGGYSDDFLSLRTFAEKLLV